MSGINTVPLTASLIYSTTGATDEDVIVIITGFNKPVTISSLTNTGATNQDNDTYIFTENGDFTFTYYDIYGNTGSMTAIVN